MGSKTVAKQGEYRQDIALQDGLLWVLGKGTGDFLAVNHEMEPEGASIHDYICRQFTPGRVFLDIGAHVGHYTVRAARAGCTVYAVEASPESAAALAMNLRINKLSAHIWALAAWDRPAVLPLSQAAGGPVRDGSSSLASPAAHEATGVTVAAMPLGRMLAKLDRLDVVKMDVEGADIRVLDGMIVQLVRLRPLLILESHEFYGTYSPSDMAERERELTGAAGYSWCDASELPGVQVRDKYRIGIVS